MEIVSRLGPGDEYKYAHQRVLDQDFGSPDTHTPVGACCCQCSNRTVSRGFGVAQQKLLLLLSQIGFSLDETSGKVVSQLLSFHQVAFPRKRGTKLKYSMFFGFNILVT
jgi:hypothetical protein